MTFLTFYCVVACIFAIMTATAVKMGELPAAGANEALLSVGLSALLWPLMLIYMLMVLCS